MSWCRKPNTALHVSTARIGPCTEAHRTDAARAKDGREANPSMSSARSGDRAPPSLPGFASPPSSAGIDSACTTPPTAALPRRCTCVFAVGSTQRRPGRGWATGCGAYAAPRSGGPMASVRSTPRELTSSRLSERSERSSRSELATRPWDRAPEGTPTEGRGAASEAADGGPPAAHARTRTQLTATDSKAPFAGIEDLYDWLQIRISTHRTTNSRRSAPAASR